MGMSKILRLTLEPNQVLEMKGEELKVWFKVSTLDSHLGHKGMQRMPLFPSSLLRGRELVRILHIIVLCLGMVLRFHNFF